jgi:hypothetical protein
MFQKLTVLLLTVLLSTTASAQTKKRAKKKTTTTTTTESTLPDTPPADAPVAEATPEPAAPAAPSTRSMASGTISQFNWQPAEGASAVEVDLTYNMATVTFKNAAGVELTKNELTGFLIPLGYHYGLSNDHSLGVTTSYGTITNKTTSSGVSSDAKYTGLGDILIVSRNYSAMGDAKLLYGVSLGFSPSKAKSASATSDGTISSGGLSLPIYVGYEADMGGSYWGVRLDYGMKMERKSDSAAGVESTVTGGNTTEFKGYYESGTESFWNAYLGYGMMSDTDTKTGTTTTTSKGGSYVPLGVAWGTHMTPAMLLTLHYDGDYMMKVDYTGFSSDAYLASTIGARARWDF